MDPEELDQVSRDEAPILETMRSIYSAVPMHHLGAIHGKIAGDMIVANAIVNSLPLIHGPAGCASLAKAQIRKSVVSRQSMCKWTDVRMIRS